MLSNLLNKLDGYKTYIGAGVIFVAGGLKALGVLNESEFELIMSVGTSITVVGIRASVKKLEK